MKSISVSIRKIIFDKFNDTDCTFTNDEIFSILEKNDDIKDMSIDDVETFFNQLCDKKITRNIAQNFTTMYFKLFEPLKKSHCDNCNLDICINSTETHCPNPDCHASLF